ncbi:hypothetical protein L1049_018510 [Liquidambar formosana]|uniref:DDE Tnp4 domain-containing protein n=1 Tax=Liquidambar formosana TaxID=63359 RepID=A0AAP0WN98_LIQFO
MNDNNNNANTNKKRRRRRDETDDDDDDDNKKEDTSCSEELGSNNKKKGLKEIITSLLLLEDQEKLDQEECNKASEEEKVLFEVTHKRKTQAMVDYYSDIQEYYNELDVTERMQRKRSRNKATATAAAAVSASVESLKENSDKSGGGASHHRRLWVKARSKAWWDECNKPDYPEDEFKKAFRMGKATFDTICDELNSVVAKEDTTLRNAIPVRQRVAVCIWRLATGEPLRLVSKRFGLGISTCHKLVLEVCSAIRTVLMPKYLQWPDEEALRRMKDEFESVAGIPNVVGSMYTTHIPIIAPKISVAAYFNRRHTERNQKTSYSITVQGVVDPRGVFTDVCIGWPGSMPDDQVLEKSALFQRA